MSNVSCNFPVSRTDHFHGEDLHVTQLRLHVSGGLNVQSVHDGTVLHLLL